MGWFWDRDKPATTTTTTTSSDPLRNLDPSLRDFLEKESPVKYKTSPAPPSPSPAPPTTTSTTSEPLSSPPEATSVPTLFPDGRYAHLWKTYTPISEIEASTKTDQEKLLDVLEGYKERKAQIGRAALENCVLEQQALNECWKHGGFMSSMTMCRTENKCLERCYVMQAKFLKALGYLSTYDRTPEVDESIQMHADTLYHRMLSQERAIEAAKAANQPIPQFPPILSTSAAQLPSSSPQTLPSSSSHALPPQLPAPIPPIEPEAYTLTDAEREKFKDRLKGLTGFEREVEEKALAMEIRAGESTVDNFARLFGEQAQERKERREKGKDTLGDKINAIFGF